MTDKGQKLRAAAMVAVILSGFILFVVAMRGASGHPRGVVITWFVAAVVFFGLALYRQLQVLTGHGRNDSSRER